MEYTYKLIKGADNILYVSIDPLMKDISKSIDAMMDIDISSLNDDDKQMFNLKILGLKTVYEFLGALQTEQALKDAAKQLKGEVHLSTNDNWYPAGVSHNVH
jgi:hypothetical protein